MSEATPDLMRFNGPTGSGAAGSALTIVLAHGAGATMDSPFLETVATGLAAATGQRVARFEFPYMAARRNGGPRRAPDPPRVLLAHWREVVRALGGGERLVIGGKSLGGRIASMVADEQQVRGLLCLGYPFHPAGRPERTRVEHLATLRTPTLILQGERDALGRPEEVAGYALSPAIDIEWLPDGDHSLRPRRASGRTEQQNLEATIASAAAFIERLRHEAA